jgi:acetyl-CoA carboxylase biotin carboxylase subunit
LFGKILIANRGEIALRVVRACRELGIKTVGVFSDPDYNLLHLKFVDQKVALGGSLPQDTYLNEEKIIRACELTEVDAIHPGYGFLSENGAFARKLEEKGITFIGPDADLLERIKDKLQAKRILEEAGIPVVPGSREPLKDEKEARKIAEEIGYPLFLKASRGGGGRGIRVVREPGQLAGALESAKREGKLAFGSEEVYMEKLLTKARHVEVQIVRDKEGRVAHLGERECSLQRRQQKILEEAPAPFLTEETREKLREAAIKVAEVLNYTTCGTVEFLVTEDGSFYFMELNARIQVEHPITEMVSGIDLVREQICLAAGEKLSFSPEEVSLRGHALEMRINAEDVAHNFSPSPGKISRFDVPRGPGIRVDSHCYSGYEVPPYYDSLLAKLIVWDCDRDFAIRRAREALHSFAVEGVSTTIPFHMKILQNRDFMTGNLHTKLIEENLEEY